MNVHPLAAGAWSPPTRARKTASLAYRLQAGAGISGRTKHPRHSGGGALAGLAHYMLGWPGGGSRCADDPDLPFAQSHPPLTIIAAAPAVLAQGETFLRGQETTAYNPRCKLQCSNTFVALLALLVQYQSMQSRSMHMPSRQAIVT